jgi:hypothetical protein
MEWLDEKITIEEAESTNATAPESDRPWAGKPFGGRNEEWEAMKAAMLPGDELWTFCSPFDSWKHHAGRKGIALVREAQVLRVLVTLMN